MDEPISEEVDEIARQIVDSAFQVHRRPGPGLLESVYERCLCYELQKRGLRFEAQKALPIVYDGLKIDGGLRLDLFVANKVVVELKAIDSLLPIHEAQLLTYLRLSNTRLGLLLNFNVTLIKNGIKRIAL